MGRKRIIAFMMIMMTVFSMAACGKQEVDLCDSAVREYLNAKTEAQQAQALQQYDGLRLTKQALTFTWESAGSKLYTVTFADNEGYENPWVYETPIPSIEPAGIFLPGTTYYYKVEAKDTGALVLEDSFTTKDAPVRFITAYEVTNVRDLGGWKTESGKTLRYGLLYRGGITNPAGENNFPEKDAALLRDTLGIRTEIDLRTPRQDDRNQTVSILGEDAAYYKTPIHGYGCIIPGFQQFSPVYRAYSPSITDSIREIFHILSDESNYPIYFHCNAGADRTGTVAYLISGVLGVPYEDLTRDFELTSFSQAGKRWRSNILPDGSFDPSGVMQDDQENFVAWDQMHRLMCEEYGAGTLEKTIENYLINACGVPLEEIESLRSILLG